MVLRYAKALCKIPRTSGASILAKAGLMWIGHAEFSFSQARYAPRSLLFAMIRSHSPLRRRRKHAPEFLFHLSQRTLRRGLPGLCRRRLAGFGWEGFSLRAR